MRQVLFLILCLLGTPGPVTALDNCSHVYSFLGATEGTLPTLWIGEQTTGTCKASLKTGFRLCQLRVGSGNAEMHVTRLRDDYPDWNQFESWLAKSGTLKPLRFHLGDADWVLERGDEKLILMPPQGSRPPGIVNRKTALIYRREAGPGGEIVEDAWYLPEWKIVFVLTRAASSEDARLEGYAVLRIHASR